MARTRAEIEQQMHDEKAVLEGTTYPELANITTSSNTGIWRGFVAAVGFCVWQLEKLWDAFKAEIAELLKQNVYGTLPWYSKIAKEFQWNASITYTITLNEKREFVYASPVPADQIIKFASATETLVGQVPLVTLKIAAADGDGRPTPIPTDALTAFKEEYLSRKKPAGVRTNAISPPPDEVLPTIQIQHSALVVPSELRDRLNAAFEAYLKALPFDGEIGIEALRDALQDTDREAVRDVHIPSCLIYSAGGSTVADLVATRREKLAAGYAVPHPDYLANNTTYLILTAAL